MWKEYNLTFHHEIDTGTTWQDSRREILFKGKDLTKLSQDEMRKVRGNEISMIFQEPMTSLNPVFTVGYQISEAIMLHKKRVKRPWNRQ